MFDFDKPVWNSREDLFINKPETAGLYEGQDKIYQYAYPDSDYPILRLPFDIFDGKGDVLSHGMYMIALDSERKYLLFIQSGALKARVPVAAYSEKMSQDKDFIERERLASEYQKYSNNGRQRKAKKYLKELEIYDKRVRTKMSATIDTSLKDVYILTYETAFQKAFAIIPVY